MGIKIKNVLIGSDPEIFLQNKNGKIISSIPYIPGTKDEPFPITEFGHALQTDNIMTEFCVPAVSIEKPEVMCDNIMLCLNYINNYVKRSQLETLIEASAIISDTELSDPKASEFGCDPSYNAWKDGKQNTKPNSNNPHLRTCGGHIHIGYDNSTTETNMLIIKALDLFLGVPSILIDTDTRRRELYGKAGEFRHKYYGVEYRVLSNFWIKDQEHINWVFNNIQKALEFIEKNTIDEETSDMIQTTINNCDKDTAEYLTEIFNINTQIYQETCVEAASH
jgi:hypothetical protein